jgi:serine/threonine-protein kinase HipA
MTALDVYLHSDRIGSLERLPGAQLSFAYEFSWAATADAGVSLSLPLHEGPFDDFRTRPFFAGLLPEGDFLKAVGRAFHVSTGNPFSLLEEIGGECAGAVSLVPEGGMPPFRDAPPPQWLNNAELARLLADLPNRPLLAPEGGEDGIRLSLAGTRDKLPVLWRDGAVGITRGRPPSTHIVKRPPGSITDLVANEAFCMALAGEVGLPVAEASPLAVGAEEGLLVRRYDRIEGSEPEVVHRIHQEDFCQALGFLPEEKYQADGGPGVAECGALIRAHSGAPAVDLPIFLDALLFNLIVGNADAHAKNYSMLLEGARAPRLAPLYDLVSTRVYGRPFSRKMAMKYGGEYRDERIRGRHLDRLAADLELTPSAARRRAVAIADRIAEASDGARARLPQPWQEAIVVEKIIERAAGTAAALRRAAAEPA